MKYWFVNISLAKIIKFLPYIVIFGLLIGWFLEFTWWMPPIVLLILIGVLLIISSGYVEVKKDGEITWINIQTFFMRESFQGPFSMESWWKYDYTSNNVNLQYNETVAQTESSDIHVFLSLRDRNKKTILFKESIVFGTRFPNDVTYDTNKSLEVIEMLMVNRADKLQKFLVANINNNS